MTFKYINIKFFSPENPPTINVVSYTPANFRDGGTVTLHCQASSSSSPLTYQWFATDFNGNSKDISKSNYNHESSTGRLTISSLKHGQDDGYFYCVAMNAAGRVRSRRLLIQVSCKLSDIQLPFWPPPPPPPREVFLLPFQMRLNSEEAASRWKTSFIASCSRSISFDKNEERKTSGARVHFLYTLKPIPANFFWVKGMRFLSCEVLKFLKMIWLFPKIIQKLLRMFQRIWFSVVSQCILGSTNALGFKIWKLRMRWVVYMD